MPEHFTTKNGYVKDEQHYVLVFHDQSHDTVPAAKEILGAARKSTLLKTVVDACSAALRYCTLADVNNPFSSIEHAIQFCEAHGEQDAVVSSVLSCFNQFGYLALLWEQQNTCFNPRSATISAVGLCTGTLAATASLFISSEEDIRILSRELIAISYRLGLEADRRSDAIDPEPASWSLALKNVSEAETRHTLKRFNEKNKLASHRHAYVSAIMPKSLTISGPPSTLKLLLSQPHLFPNSKQMLLPIYGAFHAEHLICPDLDRIIGDANLDQFKRQASRDLVFPEVSNKSEADSLTFLVREMIRRCFQKELHLRHNASPLSENSDTSSYRLISMGKSGHAENVQDWLCGSRNIQQIDVSIESLSSPSCDLAIVGYAGRFPKADNLEEFWDIIVSGKDVHEFIPKDRFDARRYYDSTAKGKNTTNSPYGCFMNQAGAFDNAFFNLSPRESLSMDPTQRILLTVTQEALEMAGYSIQTVQNKRIGTFFGQATDDWRESHASQNIDIFYLGGGMRAFAPGRINYHYKWEGPSYSVDTACSSSLTALELAARAVHSGDCDMAVAGGGNLISALPMFSGLSKGKFTSPTGSCKTFDITADGYCRGEGVGVVIIKRIEEALKENDNIKGLISAINTNHSANAVSITHPHAPAQEALMRRTLNIAGLKPHEIDYVEFHGTGTQAGDDTELHSVGDVFDDAGARKSPLYVGAVKANVGHGEAAAGITSLIKSLLMIKHDVIPPHVGIKSEVNRTLRSEKSSVLVVPEKATNFQDSKAPRRILINNFNATGGNTSMILSSHMRADSESTFHPFSEYLIAVSAQSETSLLGNLTNMKKYISNYPTSSLADLSYTTTARRQHFQFRQSFVVDSVQSLSIAIDTSLNSLPQLSTVNNSPPMAFIFAGQGTQAQGIASGLFRDHASFRQSLIEYNDICVSLGFPSFLEFITDSESCKDWTAIQLQLGVVALEIALAKAWIHLGISPDVVIGHSLGEYAALYTAGVLSLVDTFYLVGERAKLMERHCEPHAQAMLSVSQSAADVNKFLQELGIQNCGISCYNTEKSVVVSGPVESLDKIEQHLNQKSVKHKRLDVRYAFHSAMMDPILPSYHTIAASIPFSTPKIPVASTLTGTVIDDSDTFNPEYLVDQCRKPVDFVGALKAYQDYLDDDADTIWIELGPGNPACLPLVHGIRVAQDRSRLISSLDTRSGNLECLLRGLQTCYQIGAHINWGELFNIPHGRFNLLDLPHYEFETQDFWIPSQIPQTQEEQPRHRLSPLLHFVEYIQSDEHTSFAEFSSDLNDPDLFNAIRGHLVFGAALCPSSVYSSIALEAANHLFDQTRDQEKTSAYFEIYDMAIQRPLIVSESNQAVLNISASFNFKDSVVIVAFSSQSENDATSHARCKLRLSTADRWRSDWSKVDFLVKTRTETMSSSKDETLNRLNRAVIYKLFSHVVEYDKLYHGIKSIILDNEGHEATAEVVFQSTQDLEQAFEWHLIDALIHVPGFVLNNGIDETEHAYISDGWDLLMVPPGLKQSGNYTCYTRLSPFNDHKTFGGDVFLLSGSTVIAACTGLRFTRISIKSLRSLISKSTSHSSNKTELETKSVTALKTNGPKSNSSEYQDSIESTLKIISEESGVPRSRISDDSRVQDLGLDSILVTQVVDRIKKEIDIDVSAENVTNAKDVGDLKGFVESLSQDCPAPPDQDSRQILSNGPSEFNSQSSVSDPNDHRSPAESEQSYDLGDVFRDIIANEASVSASDVETAENLSEIGLDSLLSSEVIDRVQQETGKSYPSSFLKDNANMRSIRESLYKELSGNCKQTTRSPDQPEKDKQDETNGRATCDRETRNKMSVKRKCKVTFLQGDKRCKRAPLILLPPGMGTTAIYTKLPTNSKNTPMYALHSPFLDDGMAEDFTMENAITSYLSAISEICESGSLHLGGWSIGGALAYEAARRLILDGRNVLSLIVIDCPFPPNLGSRPNITYEALEMMGYNDFTKTRHGDFPRYLTEHVIGAMNAFRVYKPRPMSVKQRPGYSCFISATHGSQEKFMERALTAQEILNQESAKAGQYDTERARALLEERSPNTRDYVECRKEDPCATGWESLLGNELDIKIVEADHISLLMEESPISELGKHINDIV